MKNTYTTNVVINAPTANVSVGGSGNDGGPSNKPTKGGKRGKFFRQLFGLLAGVVVGWMSDGAKAPSFPEPPASAYVLLC